MLTVNDIMKRYEEKAIEKKIVKYCNDGLTRRAVAKHFMISKSKVDRILSGAKNANKSYSL